VARLWHVAAKSRSETANPWSGSTRPWNFQRTRGAVPPTRRAASRARRAAPRTREISPKPTAFSENPRNGAANRRMLRKQPSLNRNKMNNLCGFKARHTVQRPFRQNYGRRMGSFDSLSPVVLDDCVSCAPRRGSVSRRLGGRRAVRLSNMRRSIGTDEQGAAHPFLVVPFKFRLYANFRRSFPNLPTCNG